MKGIAYKDETMGADYELVDIPEEYRERAQELREKMVEAIAETDDELLEKYLSGEEITDEELKAALRRATIANRLQPVICGSAFKNKGVQPLLDAVVDYLPSPEDIPPVQGLEPGTEQTVERTAEDAAAVRGSGLQDHDATRSSASSPSSASTPGTSRPGTGVFNATKDTKERIGRLLQDARQQARGDRRGLGGRHRRRRRPEAASRPATRSAIRAIRSCSRR